MIFCARGTRTIGMCSFDARSGRSLSPHPRRRMVGEARQIEEKNLGGLRFEVGGGMGKVEACWETLEV